MTPEEIAQMQAQNALLMKQLEQRSAAPVPPVQKEDPLKSIKVLQFTGEQMQGLFGVEDASKASALASFFQSLYSSTVQHSVNVASVLNGEAFEEFEGRIAPALKSAEQYGEDSFYRSAYETNPGLKQHDKLFRSFIKSAQDPEFEALKGDRDALAKLSVSKFVNAHKESLPSLAEPAKEATAPPAVSRQYNQNFRPAETISASSPAGTTAAPKLPVYMT